MPRFPRLTEPAAVHHVISRFVDREWFLVSTAERDEYLARLAAGLALSDWRCLAYGLMSNHIHLAVVGGLDPPESWLKATHAAFARNMNRRRGRLGPLFAERPEFWIVRATRVPRLIAYIHNNPVRAGVAHHASDSAWTSHRAYTSLEHAPEWLDVEDGLTRCGFDDTSAGRRAFDDYVAGEISRTRMHPTLAQVVRMRREIRGRGPVEIGTPTTGADTDVEIPMCTRPGSILIGPSKASAAAVVRAANVVVGTPITTCVRRKHPGAMRAKRVALLLAERCGTSRSDIAAALGIALSTASRLARSERWRCELEPEVQRGLIEIADAAPANRQNRNTVP